MNAEQNEQEWSTSALRSLAGTLPPPDVRRRIVEGALARRERRTPWAKIVTGLALAGAATAAAVLVFQPVAPPTTPAAPAPLVAQVGDVAGAGRFAVGPHLVDVADGGSVRFASVDPTSAEMLVEAGSATFDVEPLGVGGSFRVRTGQVLVEVVGTRFEVAADGACSTVAVSEGRVRVTDADGTRYLGLGESGRYCARAPEANTRGEALVREAVVLVSRNQDLPRAAELLERYRTTFAGGPFEEEALFYLTLVKDRLGDRPAAEELAKSFRSRFPGSPRAERLDKWLERTGD